jgi:cytoskeletal protein CcmA (bactofilin family)
MTHLGATIVITGELTSSEDVTVEGRIDGLLLVRDAAVTIGERAQIQAEVRGARVLVRGLVNGAISASERIELTTTATVDGSLSANRVVLADGAQFNGRIDMDQRTIAARVAQFKSAQTSAAAPAPEGSATVTSPLHAELDSR